MERNILQEIKVGLFVIFFMALIGIAAYILGGSSDIFEPTYTLHTWYRDVKGLKVGAIVRVAGVDVGQVAKVEFETKPIPADLSEEKKKRRSIYVELNIQKRFSERIREDSEASISTVGLLGDMYITVSTGAADRNALSDGAEIESVEALDFLAYADQATAIVENARSISKKMDLMLGDDASAQSARISDSLAHIEAMLAEAEHGKGLLHTLIYDQSTAISLKHSLANLEKITDDAAAITGEVRHGDGLANTVIYGDGGPELVKEITTLADALEGVVSDLKTQDSLVHSLLYDPEKAQMMTDLETTVASLRSIVAAVDAGEGSAGLFIRDPSVYEDLRTVLGGAKRNALLRAYVRSTVEKGRREQGAAGWTPPSDDPNNGGR